MEERKKIIDDLDSNYEECNFKPHEKILNHRYLNFVFYLDGYIKCDLGVIPVSIGIYLNNRNILNRNNIINSKDKKDNFVFIFCIFDNGKDVEAIKFKDEDSRFKFLRDYKIKDFIKEKKIKANLANDQDLERMGNEFLTFIIERIEDMKNKLSN